MNATVFLEQGGASCSLTHFLSLSGETCVRSYQAVSWSKEICHMCLRRGLHTLLHAISEAASQPVLLDAEWDHLA